MKKKFIFHSLLLVSTFLSSYTYAAARLDSDSSDIHPTFSKSILSHGQDMFDDLDLKRALTHQKNSNFEDIDPLKQAPLKIHSPFVKELENNKFEIAKDVQNIIPTLIDMNLLTYAMGRNESEKIISLTELFAEQDWKIRPFAGFSGKDNRIEDIPGFVAYNRQTNQFIIAIRGSQTKDDEQSSADWEVNFDNQMIKTDHGYMHRGFYQRTTVMMDDILTQLQYFYKNMPPEDREGARIVVTGHSQGAALGTLVSAILCERLKDDLFFGRNFDNKKTNTVVAYLLSVPRVGDQISREWIHAIVGKENMIRQNVTGGFLADPVPSGSPGKTMTKILSKIPFVGERLALKYGGEGGAASIGYLAADLSQDALTRRVVPETKALIKRTTQKLGATVNELKQDLQQNPFHFFKRLAPTFADTFADVSKDVLLTYLAPYHYGGTMDQFKSGVYFQSNIVAGYSSSSPTLDVLLEQGVQKKQTTNWFNQIKKFIKNL